MQTASTFGIATHGDSWQKRWHHVLRAHWPQYEPFWREFIAPQTYRILDEENMFLRPSVAPHLVAIADADYATFYHVAQMGEWRNRFADWSENAALGGTEVMYCFFAHAYSAIDSAVAFGVAVNRALAEYGREDVFRIDFSDKQRTKPCRLRRGWGTSATEASWEAFRNDVREIRNRLMHSKPVFIQTRFVPMLHVDNIEAVSGLTEVARLAQDKDRWRERYVDSDTSQLDALIGSAGQAFDGLWAAAYESLEQALDGGLRDDLFRIDPADATLTKAQIDAIRNW